MRNELTDNFKSGGTANRFSLPGLAAWTTISADSPAQLPTWFPKFRCSIEQSARQVPRKLSIIPQ
jgi:hypothetical protein